MAGDSLKVLIVAGSGGHAVAACILRKQLPKKYNIEFMLDRKDTQTHKKLKAYKQYLATEIRGKNENIFFTIARIIISSAESIIIFLKSKPDAIITTGPGIAIPITILGKIFGKKIIYIESWSRVNTKSLAGKIFYKYADQFYIQWKQNLTNYPNAIYAGRFNAEDY